MARLVQAETATIVAYRVSKCGYAERGTEDIVFGRFSDLVSDIVRFCKGRQLGQTRIIARPKDRDELGVFLLDARLGTKDRFLFTVWNELPVTNGRVASVRANSVIGAPAVVLNRIREGTIPGYATYFYLVPSRSIVLAIRFQQAGFGYGNFKGYLRAFLRYCGRHVVLHEQEGLDVIRLKGYAEVPGRDEPARMSPVLRMDRCVRLGDVARILDHPELVTKVLRRSDLDLQVSEDRALWQRMAAHVSLSTEGGRAKAEPIRVQYQIDRGVSRAEVRQIIKDYGDEASAENWEDVGFVLRGEPQHPYWLSHSLPRMERDLVVRRDPGGGVVSAATILTAVEAVEDEILDKVA